MQVQVLFDGEPVDGLQQMVLAVRNAGNTVVTHAPDEQLYVEFPETVTLLTADLGGTPEGDLSFGVRVAAEEHRVYIDFARLKRREEFSLSVFFYGDLGSGTPKLKGRSLATLATVVRLGVDKPTTGVSAATVATAAAAVLAALFGSLFTVLASARKTKAEMKEAELRTALGEINADLRKLNEELGKELSELRPRRVGGDAGRDQAVQEPPTEQNNGK
ncbi:MAG: hypothetical protein NT125_08810 [Candidatus Bipolaricaulota bacterium]|nr:hypothetical protein [Candidatus Bipolaricaulota bacterium]